MDVPRRLQLVREFFFIIFETCEKQHLLRLITDQWDLSHQYRHYFSIIPDIGPSRLAHYQKIYNACEAQDAGALVQAIRGLYGFVKQTLIPRLREQDQADYAEDIVNSNEKKSS